MTITAESIARARDPHTSTDPHLAVYCRTEEHDRCSMVCACPCHEVERGTSWALLSASEQKLAIVEVS